MSSLGKSAFNNDSSAAVDGGAPPLVDATINTPLESARPEISNMSDSARLERSDASEGSSSDVNRSLPPSKPTLPRLNITDPLPPALASGQSETLDDESTADQVTTPASTVTPLSPLSNPGVPDFIRKLFRMLADASYSAIVSWGKNRDSFVVKDPNEFASQILPKHFKHNNFASFVRQLNKYDFHKVKTSAEEMKIYGDRAWEFHHPQFHPDKRDELDQIRRKVPAVRAKDDASGSSSGSSSKEISKDSLVLLTGNLQAKVDALTRAQDEMASYLHNMSRNYHVVVEELMQSRRTMAAQDNLMQDLVQYVVAQDSSKGVEYNTASLPQAPGGILDASHYATPHPPFHPSAPEAPDLARASVNQMCEISRQLMAHSRRNSADKHLLPSSGLDSLMFPTSDRPSSQASSSIPPPWSNPSNADNEGLTVFTVGHLTPRTKPLATPSGSRSTSLSGNASGSAQGSASMMVHRSTLVPGWTVPPKVLLVEDDATYRQISGKLLRVFGCSFDVAVDGIAAVSQMNLTKYDIVLMDIVMPNLDGVSATTRIRQFDQNTPIISMTSNTTEGDCITYLTNGMNDILAKPFSKASLYSMLEKYCAHLPVMQGRIPPSLPSSRNDVAIYGNANTDAQSAFPPSSASTLPASNRRSITSNIPNEKNPARNSDDTQSVDAIVGEAEERPQSTARISRPTNSSHLRSTSDPSQIGFATEAPLRPQSNSATGLAWTTGVTDGTILANEAQRKHDDRLARREGDDLSFKAAKRQKKSDLLG